MSDYRMDLEKGLKDSLVSKARVPYIVSQIDVERNNQSANKRTIHKYTYLVASVFIIGLIAMLGISFNSLVTNNPSGTVAETTITERNPTEVPSVAVNDLKPETILYDHNYDNMDRGAHDFLGWKVAVDPNYKLDSNSRGDIILFKNPENVPTANLEEKSISRIVGLPGEKIKIEKGQIFINGKPLETFYGRAHRLGQDVEGLKMLLDRDGLEDHLRENIENTTDQFENYTMGEIKIAENQFFIVGDDWFRSKDSRFFGPLPVENIIGKVIGYVHRPKNEDGQTDDAIYEAVSTTPDLVKAIGVDGTEGYVRKKDLEGEMPRTPAEALTQQKNRPPGGRDIPLYAADGKTVIGVFHIQ